MSLPDVLLDIIHGVPAVSRATDPPRLRSPGTETIKVYIGTETPPYETTLHKGLVCAASKVFRTALTGNKDGSGFAEAQTNEMKFPEEDPTVFAAMCDWLYGQFPGTARNKGKLVMPKDKASWHKYWFEIFCLADRLMCPGLQLYAWEQIMRIFQRQQACQTFSRNAGRHVRHQRARSCHRPQRHRKTTFSVISCTGSHNARPTKARLRPWTIGFPTRHLDVHGCRS